MPSFNSILQCIPHLVVLFNEMVRQEPFPPDQTRIVDIEDSDEGVMVNRYNLLSDVEKPPNWSLSIQRSEGKRERWSN